ncbi:MAG: methylmalonyl-CoA mutase subunit beta, partial [Acidobacteria bacterium]|nr:methylmalonyl-CoA mutase subunit beta [Acidobacteriota bacterium]
MASTKLFEEFPPVSTEQWEQLIQKDLKGADYAKKLLWQTEEGITVEPYYRTEDIEGLPYLDTAPGEFPYLRGTRPDNGWKIREELDETNPMLANSLALKALAAGAEEIAFVNPAVTTAADFAALTAGLGNATLHFEGSEALYRLAVDAGAASGSVALDPLANPGLAAELLGKAAPGFKTAVIGGYRFGDAGATVVQELAYALAAGIEALAALTDRGIPAERANQALAFTLSVGSNYCFEVARLRAARLLWTRVLVAYGVLRNEARGAFWCRTSWWNKTVYDPYVNLLRTTTEAMSAAVGGADAITVLPFNATYRQPDEFSRHLARNTQTILKHEAWLDRVADPAGGSWYVEKLTDSIAHEAWKLVQVIESHGGYLQYSDAIQTAVEKSRQAREAAIASRRRPLLGTNQYPNLNDRMLPEIDPAAGAGQPRRGAEVFEELRLATERHGAAPVFLLAEAGDVKLRKARAGFIAGFFGCAGFAIDTQA